MAKKAVIDAIFNQMQFCPICGGKLKLFGRDTDYKTCDESHGVMYVTGKRANAKVGIFLELSEG